MPGGACTLKALTKEGRFSEASLFSAIDISSFDLHPDGRRAACSINRGDNYELALLDLGSGRMSTFRRSRESLMGPVFSPDGHALAYQMDFEGNEDHDIFIADLDKKKDRKITDGVADNSSAQFSPDGTRVAFLSNRKDEMEDLFFVPSKGGKVQRLTDEKLPVRDFAWSPDSTHIAYVTGIGGNEFISVLDVGKRRTRKVLSSPEADFLISGDYGQASPWMPDGNRFAYLTNEEDVLDICLFNLASRKASTLVRSEHDKYSPQISPDGAMLAYLEVCDPNLQLKSVAFGTAHIHPPSDGVSRNAVWMPDGQRLVMINGSSTRPDEVYVTDTDCAKASRLLPRQFPSNSFQTPMLIHYRSFDGERIAAILTIPRDRSRRAGVVYPHGGPEMQSLNVWDQMKHMLLSRGFFVIEPNYRGSTGYGRRFQRLHDLDLGGGDYVDTVYAGKYLVDNGLVDSKRLAYWGASYSGFTCMLALTKYPSMWAAGVSIVGFFDYVTEMETERGYLRAYDDKVMGPIKGRRDFFRERSPIFFLESLSAPLLMTASARDVRCPPTESRAVVERLRRLGKPVEYHEYKGEGHWPRKRKNLIDLYRRSAEFLDKHIPR